MKYKQRVISEGGVDVGNWVIKKPDSDLIDEYIGRGFTEKQASILANRGITPEESRDFCFAGLNQLNDPYKMREMPMAIEIIKYHIDNGNRIAIYGDYDADGITGSAVLYKALQDMGADVVYRLPVRSSEGYGMHELGIRDLFAQNVKLIITVDNGIKCQREIDLAHELGMMVVVTDHHDCPEKLPAADAIINPQRSDETYPFKHLAGCGIAFKLAQVIYMEYGLPIEFSYRFLPLVAIGTVADCVPLLDENRIIVREGLKLLNRETEFRGLEELKKVLQLEEIDWTTLGFFIGPAINAIGRLEDADLALELFLVENSLKAKLIANRLQDLNKERQKITEETMEEIERIIDENELLKDKVLVAYEPSIPEGIVGLVAGRLTEKYNKPAIVITKGEDCFKASCRSIEGFHMLKALEDSHEFLIKFGGHSQAAGFSMEADIAIVEEFRMHINEYANNILKEDDMVRCIEIDGVLEPHEVDMKLVESLRELGPYGEGFPEPVFLIQNFRINKVITMGKANNHLKLKGGYNDAVAFSMVDKYMDMGQPDLVDIVAVPTRNVFRGWASAQLDVKDFKPSLSLLNTSTLK